MNSKAPEITNLQKAVNLASHAYAVIEERWSESIKTNKEMGDALERIAKVVSCEGTAPQIANAVDTLRAERDEAYIALEALIPVSGHICRPCWDRGCDTGKCTCPCHSFSCPQRESAKNLISRTSTKQ